MSQRRSGGNQHSTDVLVCLIGCFKQQPLGAEAAIVRHLTWRPPVNIGLEFPVASLLLLWIHCECIAPGANCLLVRHLIV